LVVVVVVIDLADSGFVLLFGSLKFWGMCGFLDYLVSLTVAQSEFSDILVLVTKYII
jgi:hypothetical protein